MAVPKKKISIAKKNQRTSTWEMLKIKKMLNKLSLVKCPNCGNLKQNHHVCPYCGYYKNSQVLTIKSKNTENIIQA